MNTIQSRNDRSARVSRNVLPAPRCQPGRAPSFRIPPRPGNRAYLRALRAAESAAWDAAMPRTRALPGEVSALPLRGPGQASATTASPGRGVSGAEAARGTPIEGAAPMVPADARPVRLPSAAGSDPAENRGHALLSLLAIVAVGFGLWTTGVLAQHWGEVVASVQRLVSGW